MKTTTPKPSLAERAAEKLGEALAELTSAQVAEAVTTEHLKSALRDLNDLLQSVSPGAEVMSVELLKNATWLRSHLQASMELAAQELVKALPNRLNKWLAAEPSPEHPDRLQWLENGMYLLEGAEAE